MIITKEFNENVLFTCTLDIKDNIDENTKVLGTLYTDQTKELEKLAEMMKSIGLDPNSYATNRGVYCGYVLLSKKHPFFGKTMDEINSILAKDDERVNGGLTFSELNGYSKIINEPALDELKDYWCIGFDTAHINDTREYWTHQRFLEELDYLTELMEKYS